MCAAAIAQASKRSILEETAQMMRTLLSRLTTDLLCARVHPDLVDPPAGNALLALIVVQQGHWHALVGALLNLQSDSTKRHTLATAFSDLLSTNGVSASLAKPNRTRFRANLQVLLQRVHALNVQLPP